MAAVSSWRSHDELLIGSRFRESDVSVCRVSVGHRVLGQDAGGVGGARQEELAGGVGGSAADPALRLTCREGKISCLMMSCFLIKQ